MIRIISAPQQPSALPIELTGISKLTSFPDSPRQEGFLPARQVVLLDKFLEHRCGPVGPFTMLYSSLCVVLKIQCGFAPTRKTIPKFSKVVKSSQNNILPWALVSASIRSELSW